MEGNTYSSNSIFHEIYHIEYGKRIKDIRIEYNFALLTIIIINKSDLVLTEPYPYGKLLFRLLIFWY